jgi:glycine/D-amino acid oxidase-like deaminating enzyme
MRVIIVGGGVIGTAIAYRLAAQTDIAVTVIERNAIACAASGKSGGFLARDWCDGTPLMHLARRSFDLHAELAAALNGERDWGYRRMTTYTGTASSGTAGRHAAADGRSPSSPWIDPAVALQGRIGSPATTAQVQPGDFSAAMMRAAQAHGAELRLDTVTGLRRRGDTVTGVAFGDEHLDADAVIIAMGPWSILATGWLPLPPVYGLKGHSLVFDTGPDIPPEALFLEYAETASSTLSPEVFPRADGTTYVCGLSGEAPLPVDPDDVTPDDGAIERLHDLCARISPVLADAPILKAQACYRPITQDGLPLIGAIPGIAGAYIATGHSVWGILNAPATAEAMAELLLDGAAHTTDLRPFDPARLPIFRGTLTG